MRQPLSVYHLTFDDGSRYTLAPAHELIMDMVLAVLVLAQNLHLGNK